MIRAGLCALLLGLALPAFAENAADALQWLQRASIAAGTLSYSGVFIYQADGRVEASRIVHRVEGGKEQERLVVLDGSPREVLREGDEVKCYLPESRLLVLERRQSRLGFPALLPEGLGGLSDYYVVRRGPPGRVAGLEAQSVQLDPRDAYRLARQFWLDAASGLLLKADLRDEQGGLAETFAFTELHLGAVAREELRPRAQLQGGEWRVHDIRAQEMPAGDQPWQFNASLPGFRRVSMLRRPARGGAPESTHVVFSDGVAAISVFIEPVMAGRPSGEPGLYSMGAINVYRRIAGDTQFVVMGDVPPRALKLLGDGIAPRRK